MTTTYSAERRARQSAGAKRALARNRAADRKKLDLMIKMKPNVATLVDILMEIREEHRQPPTCCVNGEKSGGVMFDGDNRCGHCIRIDRVLEP